MNRCSFLRINSSQKPRQQRFSKLEAHSTSYLLLESCGPWRVVLLSGKKTHIKGTWEGGREVVQGGREALERCGGSGEGAGLRQTVWGPQESCEALEGGPRRSRRPQGRCRTLQRGVRPQRQRRAVGRVSSWGRIPSWAMVPSQGRVSP